MYKLDKTAQDALNKIYTQFKSASEITVSAPKYEKITIDYLITDGLLEKIDASTLNGWVYIVRPTHEGKLAYSEILKQASSKINNFILQGETIMKEEYHHLTDHGLAMPDFICGPKSDQWFSEISIFNDRTLVNHPLHDQIENVCKNHRNQFSPHENMMGYLRALAEDDEFFEKTEQRKDAINMGFNKLPSNSEQLLRELLNSSNPTDYLAGKFKDLSNKEDNELRGIIRELKSYGYVDVLWADNLPYHVTLNNSARTYYEHLAEYKRKNAPTNSATTTPQTINNYYGSTNVINAPNDGAVIVAGNNNVIDFSYNKAGDIVSEIESSLNDESIPSEERETAMELLSEIKEKITVQKKPSIIKSAFVGLKDFLIGIGASSTVAIIQAKMQGLF
ncbi:MAG: hypothetical protein K6F76_05910 [Clostridiales bacterium]|nr:hypothetical protein [Clostridiales bacterium]